MRYRPELVRSVAPGVYPPSEDTRLLVESIEAPRGGRVLDVGTGSGAVALHCADAGAAVIATDITGEAVSCARENALAKSLDIDVIRTDMLAGVSGRFDLITFNPPYLPDEDGLGNVSLDGGKGGAEVLMRFLSQLEGRLSAEGRAVVIISSHTDAKGMGEYKVLREKGMFFEKLYALEFRRT